MTTGAEPQPASLPDPGDSGAALRDALTAAYGLHSPIATVHVYGMRRDSPVVLELADGTPIRAEAGDLMRTTELARILAMATHGRSQLQHTKADELRFAFGLLMALAQIQETDDEVAEVHEWVQRFISASGGQVEDVDLSDGNAAYAAVGAMQSARYAAHAGAALILRDTTTGDLYLRVSDLVTYVREVIGVRPMSAANLNPRMAEAGYARHLLQQWKPGADRRTYRKRKVSTYIVRRDTEDDQ